MILFASIGAAAWAAGFLAVAGRSLYGYWALWSLGRTGSIPFSRPDIPLDELARRVMYPGQWELRECATRDVVVPITWGCFHSTVMLPLDAHRWSKARLEAVILHELAHVKRRDFVAQAFMALACAVFWFIPAVWVAAEDLRANAEREADQAVLWSGVRASDYAFELLSIATEISPRRLSSICVGTPAMKNSSIASRLHAILESDHELAP